MKYTIENNTEYEISDNIKELLELYISCGMDRLFFDSFKIIVDIENLKFVKFKIDKLICGISMASTELYIHRDLINKSDHLFIVNNIMTNITVFSLNIKYYDDYMLLIKENRIDEFDILPFNHIKFKDIKLEHYEDGKYLGRYEYTMNIAFQIILPKIK